VGITVTSLSKSFGTSLILAGISLDIHDREIVSIIGPTGCGKTTLLNILARVDTPDSGSVSTVLNKKAVGYMMQEAALLPWRTLAENALLGTELITGSRNHGRSSIDAYFKAFELELNKDNYPETSSAGMKQRVALIRTLLINPCLLLLDEPFSNLDFDIKLKIQRRLIQYYCENESTFLLVTHDIEDAIALSDKVIILSDKPTTIKVEVPIDLGLRRRDPVDARKSPRFSEYFAHIWNELKYLDDND
jgi:NitT/TauT family transport system ATP-binding protein